MKHRKQKFFSFMCKPQNSFGNYHSQKNNPFGSPKKIQYDPKIKTTRKQKLLYYMNRPQNIF